MAVTTASGTSCPLLVIALSSRPMGVSALTSARMMSPVEMAGMPSFLDTRDCGRGWMGGVVGGGGIAAAVGSIVRPLSARALFNYRLARVVK